MVVSSELSEEAVRQIDLVVARKRAEFLRTGEPIPPKYENRSGFVRAAILEYLDKEKNGFNASLPKKKT